MDEQTTPGSVQEVSEALARVSYLADEPAALVSFLAQRLGKPVLVEGPAGVGKTELAKALARASGRELVRLQCYEGLDEAKALYEWNYRKQLLRIQATAAIGEPAGDPHPGEARMTARREATRSPAAGQSPADRSPDGSLAAEEATGDVLEDIFSEEFLLTRPLMTAIASPEPVVLLIDEVDKTDQEFEAMLLELLSDFQITIPELGEIKARTMPIVVLTSNNTRELTEALKRRCLYLWLDYPALDREMEIVRLHTPEIDERLARRLVEVVHMVRQLDLRKPPSIAESIDWARTLLLIGAEDIDRETFERSISILVKHRTDIDLVSERVGVKLGEPAGT
jgi:MoxR-like ATPase